MNKREKIKYIIENEGNCNSNCEENSINPCPLIRKIGYCSPKLNLTRAIQWLKDNPEEKEMNTPISKDILSRIEHLEELAGVKKEPEQWPNVGDKVILQGIGGNITVYGIKDDSFSQWIIKNEICFKSTENYNKYYSIINTINNIVDELGRPSWDDFEDDDIYLNSLYYETTENKGFHNIVNSHGYESTGIFPYCKKDYIDRLLKKVSQTDLLWAFKKSMRLV